MARDQFVAEDMFPGKTRLTKLQEFAIISMDDIPGNDIASFDTKDGFDEVWR
jgi:hypothetical protein